MVFCWNISQSYCLKLRIVLQARDTMSHMFYHNFTCSSHISGVYALFLLQMNMRQLVSISIRMMDLITSDIVFLISTIAAPPGIRLYHESPTTVKLIRICHPTSYIQKRVDYSQFTKDFNYNKGGRNDHLVVRFHLYLYYFWYTKVQPAAFKESWV